ncbi:MAG TPA: LysR substrate-binding domain-containing protein [Candidatus Methylacidiphilales bacterium]|nr:LysR substrate-binding domain-containing protein [Candidatus Methylacidiphilales bacterium]
MELRHLRYFVAVAEELNFRRAAMRLHISQPPLSTQIRDLEDEIGVHLFDRSRRAIALTAAGERFLIDARRILAEAHHAETTAKKVAAGIVGQLRLGFMLSTAHKLLGDAVQKFKQRYPAVEISLLDLTNSEQIQALNEDRLDIAFTRSRIIKPNLETEILVEEPMVIMVPSRDALAKKKRLAWKDLAGKTVVSLHPDQALGYYDNFFLKCKEAKISVVTGQYANDIHTEMWLVSIGMGLAPTSFTTTQIRRPNVSFCRLPSNLPKVQTVMSWKKSGLSPVKSNFIAIIRQLASSSGRIS